MAARRMEKSMYWRVLTRRPGQDPRNLKYMARPWWRLWVDYAPVVVGIPHVDSVVVRDPYGIAEAVFDPQRLGSDTFHP